jgi:methionyl-tRNA synthetase
LNYEGKKFSKSKKIGVFCEKLPEIDIPVDIWRAYLSQLIPETNDTEFKWKEFQERINSDLIGNFGNLVNRVLSFVKSRYEGKISKPKTLSKTQLLFIKEVEEKTKEIEALFESCEIRKAYSEILALSSKGNKFFNDNEPWKTVKEDKEETEKVLFVCLELIKRLSLLISPFIPDSSKKIWAQINKEKLGWKDLFLQEKTYDIGEVKTLFTDLDDNLIETSKKIACDAPNLKEFFKK